MKRTLFFGTLLCLVGSTFAADSGPKDEVKGAAKKLSDQPNYSWKSNIEMGGAGGGGGGQGGRGRFGGPTDGKTEKDGFTMLSMARGDNTIEAVLKGGKGAIKTQEGWQSLSEAADAAGGGGGGGGQNAGRFMARMLQSFKAPAAQADDLVAKCKDLKKADGAYTGDLTEEGVKELLSFGPRRGGGDAPAVSNAKGSAKFWLKDGVLSKYEFKVQGSISFNGNDREVERTTTVEVKEVGSTKVSPPDEAKKKIS